MKSRKIFSSLIIAACFANHSVYANTAADTSFQNVEPSNSESTIQKTAQQSSSDKATLKSRLAVFTSLKADFQQVITDLQGQELQRSTGQILLQKPQQLRWSVAQPEESLLIADGTTVYNVDPFVEQVTLMDQAQLTKSNPLMLLISDDQKQWQQVEVTHQQTTDKPEQFDIISLEADSPITKLELIFDTAGKLVELRSTDRQQQQNQLSFSNVEYNAATAHDAFTYTTQPDWIVDDQRSTQQ